MDVMDVASARRGETRGAQTDGGERMRGAPEGINSPLLSTKGLWALSTPRLRPAGRY